MNVIEVWIIQSFSSLVRRSMKGLEPFESMKGGELQCERALSISESQSKIPNDYKNLLP